MAVKYTNSSPWAKTKVKSGFLDHFAIRPVAAEDDDILYSIEPQFNHRPDLLAYYLYDSTKLWWVFTQRNLDVIQDPIFDFRAGVEIYVPKKSGLFKLLGL